jgi:periplasmic protein TonB
LHVGFFWALTHGLSIGGPPVEHSTTYVPLPQTPRPPQPQRAPTTPIIDEVFYVPKPEVPRPIDEDTGMTAPRQTTDEPPPQPPPQTGGTVAPEPVIVEPAVGRTGLSEPVYPNQAIRMGITGTVVLSVQVLPNGRVGDVRLVRSSGFPQLDESALREARRWRLVPGTRDGVATSMWKEIPITFRLRNN